MPKFGIANGKLKGKTTVPAVPKNQFEQVLFDICKQTVPLSAELLISF